MDFFVIHLRQYYFVSKKPSNSKSLSTPLFFYFAVTPFVVENSFSLMAMALFAGTPFCFRNSIAWG